MRILLLWLATFLLAWGGTAEERLRAEAARAAGEGRTLLFYTTQPGCPECRYMKQVVFTAPEVKTVLDRGFRLLEWNIRETPPPEGLGEFGVPVFYFLDKEGKPVGEPVVGAMRKELFLRRLEEVRR